MMLAASVEIARAYGGDVARDDAKGRLLRT